MSDYEKKVIKITFNILMSLVLTGLFIIGVIHLSRPEIFEGMPKWFGIVFTIISPPSLLGIYAKTYIVRKQTNKTLDEIDHKVQEYGLSKVPVSYETKIRKKDISLHFSGGVEWILTKDNNIVIINRNNISPLEFKTVMKSEHFFAVDKIEEIEQEKTPN